MDVNAVGVGAIDQGRKLVVIDARHADTPAEDIIEPPSACVVGEIRAECLAQPLGHVFRIDDVLNAPYNQNCRSWPPTD
jgi:hypothetical protein